MEFTHFNKDGRAKMVDVGGKRDTNRRAVAVGCVKMKKETARMIRSGSHKKGDVISVAQIGGIMGAKKTSELIPMCHNIFISGVDMDFEVLEDRVNITASARTCGKTGIEMEALTAVSIAALTIYDMCKAVDKHMSIEGVMLVKKIGGKSGEFERKVEEI